MGITNFAGTIGRLGTGTYTVTREGAASFTKGRASPGSTSTFSIQAAVYPASGRDMLRLEEGRRAVETRAIITATELQTAGAPGGGNADKVSIDGVTFEVQHVEPWTAGGFYKALAQRVQA